MLPYSQIIREDNHLHETLSPGNVLEPTGQQFTSETLGHEASVTVVQRLVDESVKNPGSAHTKPEQ